MSKTRTPLSRQARNHWDRGGGGRWRRFHQTRSFSRLQLPRPQKKGLVPKDQPWLRSVRRLFVLVVGTVVPAVAEVLQERPALGARLRVGIRCRRRMRQLAATRRIENEEYAG